MDCSIQIPDFSCNFKVTQNTPQMKSFFTIFLYFMLTSSYAQSPRVTVSGGTLEGIHNDTLGLNVYLGIPFAAPPVDEFRWKAPQPVIPWDGVKPAKAFGPSPLQTNVFGDMEHRSASYSEDCLYLNVWTPAGTATEKLPVLVYFYGGGFVAGSGSEPRYDGASMAQEGIVAVTVNYRLHIFGFLAHPELSAEGRYNSSGNYGLMDQHAALQWVQENIAAFGGDPDRVTIAGESAGSISVSAQMASPLSRDLIDGAIGESGASIHPTLAPVPLAEAENIGVEFVKNTGRSLAELRAMPADELFALYNESGRFGFPVTIDGYFLPATLPEIFRNREQAQVPLLLGWNSAEIPGMAFMQGQAYTQEHFIARVKEAFPEKWEEVLKLYPHSSPEEVEWSATYLASDRFISYSTWKWFDLHRKNSDAPVYRYLYSKLRPPLRDQSKVSGLAGGTADRENTTPPPPPAIGAPHACEIEYCMGNLHLVNAYAWTEEDYLVSETMKGYFANFIKTGNPNGNGLPRWPAAEASDTTPPVMVIDVESEAREAQDDDRYLFLDQFYGKAGG